MAWMIKNELPANDTQIICTGKKYGADKFIKEYSLFFDLKYSEILPYHERWNQYCFEQPYMYNKQFSSKYYFIAYNKFVKTADNIIIFDYSKQLDPTVTNIIELCKKNNKKYVIVKI